MLLTSNLYPQRGSLLLPACPTRPLPLFLSVFLGHDESNDILDVHQAIRDTSGHRRGDAKRLVDLAEVVGHEVKRDGVGVIRDLLAEGVGQAREPAHAHPHREVLALDVAR